jgi:ABC-type multidrug transport system ATPase subunit
MVLLSLEHVTKRFLAGREAIAVVDDASIEINDGDVIAIHGDRRSGKTTLMRIAAGWDPPDQGRVLFEGRDLWVLSESERARLRRRGGIGFVCSQPRTSDERPAIHLVQEAAMSDGPSIRGARGAAHRALERVGLAPQAHIPSSRLSQGELIRLELAERLVHAPRVLLIDEPALLRRPSEAAEMYQLLRELGREPGLALVISSEELAPVRMAERVFSLDRGRLDSMGERGGQLLRFPDARTAAQRS